MIIATCSWCHLENKIEGPRVHCPNCGHRADVARVACDCERCLKRTYVSGEYPDGIHSPHQNPRF